MYGVGEYNQSYEWSGKGLEYLQIIKNHIPPKELKKKEYDLYLLMNNSLVQMLTTPEKMKKLEEINKIQMEMSHELYGSESKKYCQDIIRYSWHLYGNGKEYHSLIQKVDGILQKKEI